MPTISGDVPRTTGTLRLIATGILFLGCAFRGGGEEPEKRHKLPNKLPPENHEAYKTLLDELDSNTARLLEAFKSGDQQREDELYIERERILVACQNLMPPAVEEPRILEGMVDSKNGTRLGLRHSESVGSSMNVGPIADPELREQYEAIQIGDKIRLVYAFRPDLYDNDHYSYQLQELQRIGPGIRNFDIRQQDRNEDFEGRHLTIEAGTRTGSLLFADIEIGR